MTDENFKKLCKAWDFVAGIKFTVVEAEGTSFWDTATIVEDDLKEIIEAERPGYFEARNAEWLKVKALKESGAPKEEITKACEAILLKSDS